MLTSIFDFCAGLFHMVFNRTVENLNRIFTMRQAAGEKMAEELLWRLRPSHGLRAKSVPRSVTATMLRTS